MTARELFDRADQEGFGVGAFNVSNLETLKAVVAAAKAVQSPVLVESSEGETAYFGPDNLVDLVQNAREETGLPIFVNLDHARDPANVKTAIEAGYDLVHYDGSKDDPALNLQNLTAIVAQAHAQGVLVEGERDYIIEGSEVRTITAQEGRAASQLTDPEKSAEFVRASGVDTFAVSIGNVHGLYTTSKQLDLDLLGRIRERVPCFLSLHGGSGISPDQIKQAIKIGRIVKINVSTELRKTFRDEIEQGLKAQPDQVAFYKLTPAALAHMQKIIEDKMKLFGSAGQA